MHSDVSSKGHQNRTVVSSVYWFLNFAYNKIDKISIIRYEYCSKTFKVWHEFECEWRLYKQIFYPAPFVTDRLTKGKFKIISNFQLQTAELMSLQKLDTEVLVI